jgi:hypothetical protein
VFTIGGVTVGVASDDFVLVESDDPHYASFRASGSAPPSEPDISVDVSPGPARPIAGALRFDCDGAWTVHADGEGYRLAVRSGTATADHLTALSNADTTSVRIFAGESWTRFFQGTDDGGKRLTGDPFRYPLDQLLLVHYLAKRGGIVVHSAGLVVDGVGLAFPGVSGAGKTTLSLELERAGLGDGLLSDDRTIIRAPSADTGRDRHFVVWGSPWPGDAGVARNECAILRALCFLVQDPAASLTQLAPAAAVERLFPVISCPWYDQELTAGVLDTCERLVESVPCYEFRFPRDKRAVELLRAHAAALA